MSYFEYSLVFHCTGFIFSRFVSCIFSFENLIVHSNAFIYVYTGGMRHTYLIIVISLAKREGNRERERDTEEGREREGGGGNKLGKHNSLKCGKENSFFLSFFFSILRPKKTNHFIMRRHPQSCFRIIHNFFCSCSTC